MTQTLDPKLRREAGVRQAEALAMPILAEPRTAVQAAWRDFVLSEVWSRPGLDRRSRFIIAIAGSANMVGPRCILERYVRAALTLGDLSLTELREIALHMTVYAGWSQAEALDDVVTGLEEELGLEPVPVAPLRTAPWTNEERHAQSEASFQRVMKSGGPKPVTAFFEAGIVGYVFSELWTREALDQRSRRLITLTGAADSQAPSAVRNHAYSAMASGDLTRDEMFEFVMQYAIHGGHTRASTMQALVFEMAELVEQGRPFKP